MSLLIVDDYEDNRTLLKGFLRNAGYSELIEAASAEEALGHLKASLLMPPEEKMELILMDVSMPGISGIQCCADIKADESLRDVPILMVTALTDMESLDAAFAAGAMDYIMKPIRKIELLARVRSALALRREMDCRKQRELELSKRNSELEKAMKEIKVLRGFIPICCICKKIRNLEGMWQQIEAYLSAHSEAKFSHGICDHCMKTHYSEYSSSPRPQPDSPEKAA